MLLLNFTPQRLRLLQALGWVLLVLAWVAQILGLSWRALQPVRSLRLLVIFTGLALFLVVITVLLKQISWRQRQAFLLDLNLMFDLLTSILLAFPQALGATAMANPVGRGGLICFALTLPVAYWPPDGVHVPPALRGNYPLIQRGLVAGGRILLAASLVLLLLGGAY
ncbi:hypothetical protein [Levilactobacillus andaensis]|uniref:hypothetical protein n=1 Tax=Levilactobacillus andaensis TaxID=2799570 RepID=UPI00194083FE|nr:hypothetical protein [Levilactobacillus andaensis]